LKILLFIALAAVALIGLARMTRRAESPYKAHAPPVQSMDVRHARAVLGLESGPLDKEAVVAAHRKLMQRVHPDKGGSALLAQQLNEAKRVLLAHL